jgi:hypothetical protein
MHYTSFLSWHSRFKVRSWILKVHISDIGPKSYSLFMENMILHSLCSIHSNLFNFHSDGLLNQKDIPI